jgi:hypothetical protein
LDAADWAKAVGYDWPVLDVTAGVMSLSSVPHAMFYYVRLSDHIFGGIWIGAASVPSSLGVGISGLLSGELLFFFSFASPFLHLVV